MHDGGVVDCEGGLLTGDAILYVNGIDIRYMPHNEAVALLTQKVSFSTSPFIKLFSKLEKTCAGWFDFEYNCIFIRNYLDVLLLNSWCKNSFFDWKRLVRIHCMKITTQYKATISKSNLLTNIYFTALIYSRLLFINISYQLFLEQLLDNC